MNHAADGQRYTRMPYRRTGRSGLKLPAISLGLWQNFGGDRPIETQRAVIRRAFDLGSRTSTWRTTMAAVRLSRGELRPDPQVRPDRTSRRARDLDQGRLRHVARALRESGVREQYLLASLDQSLKRMGLGMSTSSTLIASIRDSARGDLGCARHGSPPGKALYAGISSYSRRRTKESAETPPQTGNATPDPSAVVLDE